MTLSIAEVRGIVDRVFAQPDVLDACARRDLGRIILVLGTHGLTQGRISELTGISQGRLSEWARRKRAPRASSSFESFADGLGVPAAARQALGLADDAARTDRKHPAQEQGSTPAPGLAAGSAPLSPAAVPASTWSVDSLLGRTTVQAQLRDVLAALEAQQRRRAAGLVVRRPVWKNLVFVGGAGTGKARAAVAVGQAYRKLGVLSTGQVIEAAAADLVGSSPGETGKLVAEAVRPASGGILMINAAHDWHRLPERGQQVVLRRLHEQLTEYRTERRDELAVILAGEAAPLSRLLQVSPSLAARFRAVIDFPPYTPAQLALIFRALADETGLSLAPAAELKAATVLARAEGTRGPGNARLAVRLLNQATAAQGLRVAAVPAAGDLTALNTLTEADIPSDVNAGTSPCEHDWPGQYL